MLIQKLWLDAQIDIGRHAIGSMIRDDQNPAKARGPDYPVCLVDHRSLPSICHQPG